MLVAARSLIWVARRGRRIFYDKRIAQEVEADALGDEFKGYVFRCERRRGAGAGARGGFCFARAT